MIVFLFFFGRDIYLRPACAISETATEVSIFSDHLIIKTTAFKLLFLINKPARELRFNIREFSRYKIEYPEKQVYYPDRQTWKLHTETQVAYIIPDLFGEAFEQELENFLYWKDPLNA